METEFSVDEASQVEARRKSNLAFAFFCMPRDRARDMEVFYAYCRILDDIADDPDSTPERKIAALEAWKREIEAIYSARTSELSKMGAELRDTVMRRDVPKKYLLDIIDGVMRDTDPAPFETYADIKKYCYGVASAVGLASIHIFGFKNEKTREFAEALGYALQFTNILRDVVCDWKQMGRVYIPRAEMEAFGVKPEDFGADEPGENCRALFAMMHFRAKHFFNRARRLLQPEDAASLAPAFIMWGIYERILDEIGAGGFRISEKAVKIPKWRKIAIAAAAVRRAKKYSAPAAENFGRAAVFGGGIAGIAAAVNLSLKGYEVDLYESKSHVGGRAGAMEWKAAGARLDNGSHALMRCYEGFLGLLDTLGTRSGAFFPPASSIEFKTKSGGSFSYRFPMRGKGGAALFGNIFRLPKISGFLRWRNLLMLARIKLGLGGANPGETVSEYLDRHGVGAVAKSALWEPFCVSVQNTDPDEASAEMFVQSVRKSLLRGADMSALVVNRVPFADLLWPRAKLFIEACGGSVNLSSPVSDVEVSDGRVVSFKAGGRDAGAFDYAVFAVPRRALASLVPQTPVGRVAASIPDSPILNIYFTTRRKLFSGPFVALMESPLHWVFDRTETAGFGGGLNLYSITVSAFSGDFSPSSLRASVMAELEKYFGAFEFESFVPSLFRDATMLSTCASEAARPLPLGHFKNAAVVGDWVSTGLPCTMESAAKSAELPEL